MARARRRRPPTRRTRRVASRAKPRAKARPAARRRVKVDAHAEIARLAVALTAAPDLARGLEDLLSTARRVTGAEAGTVYLRRGEALEFAVVQNDILERRLGAAEVLRRLAARPLSLRETSVASYVVLTRSTVNLRDAYEIPQDRTYDLLREIDRKTNYRTHSMLATPLRNGHGQVFGVLQLINALDGRGKIGPFSKDHQALVQTVAAHATRLAGA
jgi:GAF domain-containing protein